MSSGVGIGIAAFFMAFKMVCPWCLRIFPAARDSKVGRNFERAPSKNSWLSQCVTNLAGVGARAKRHGPPVFLALVELRTLRKPCSRRGSGEYASERLADAGWNAGRGGHA